MNITDYEVESFFLNTNINIPKKYLDLNYITKDHIKILIQIFKEISNFLPCSLVYGLVIERFGPGFEIIFHVRIKQAGDGLAVWENFHKGFVNFVSEGDRANRHLLIQRKIEKLIFEYIEKVWEFIFNKNYE